MYFVYYKDRVIDFTDRPSIGCDGVVKLAAGERIGIAKMLENLENSKNICVISDDPERSFKDFALQFRLVEAAGGVVVNGHDEILMIYRNNRWDLPKGHVEAGEGFITAAVREVEEETGLRNVVAGEPIVTTYHFYPLNGEWILKRTWWFAMSGGEGEPVPQSEEGITRVEWVPVSRVPDCASQSFASVRQVLRLACPGDKNILHLEKIIP